MGLSPVWYFSPFLGRKNLFLFDHHGHIAPQHPQIGTNGAPKCSRSRPFDATLSTIFAFLVPNTAMLADVFKLTRSQLDP